MLVVNLQKALPRTRTRRKRRHRIRHRRVLNKPAMWARRAFINHRRTVVRARNEFPFQTCFEGSEGGRENVPTLLLLLLLKIPLRACLLLKKFHEQNTSLSLSLESVSRNRANRDDPLKFSPSCAKVQPRFSRINRSRECPVHACVGSSITLLVSRSISIIYR